MVSQAHAQFQVNVLSAQFTTYVMVERTNRGVHAVGSDGHFQIWSWGDTRMTVSTSPIVDEIYGPESGLLNAQARAEIFGVSTYSAIRAADVVLGQVHNATAGAESQIWFAPATSGRANLEFDCFGKYLWPFSAGVLSLRDLTENQTLWHYEWDWGGPFISNGDGTASAMLACTTDFSADHTYALGIFVQTFAYDDVELVSVQLDGLQIASAVPEPSVFALSGFGFVVLLGRRRQR